MIHFPALSAVILVVSLLTGCKTIMPKSVSKTDPSASTKQSGTPHIHGEKTEKEEQTNVLKKVVQIPAKLNDKLVVGFAETGTLTEYAVDMDAKIDTGAGRTSIDARNVNNFERDGKKWVRFDVPRTNKGNITLELPVRDTVSIKRPGEEAQQRPVVNMTVRVGHITQNLNVSLNDRTDYDYPLLVGRDFLKDMAIADVDKQYIATEKVLSEPTKKRGDQQVETVEQPVEIAGLTLLGEMENVNIEGFSTHFRARVDTGAATSSIDAREIEHFWVKGKEWVRFKIVQGDEDRTFELPVSETVLIKRHGGLDSQRRPIVKIDITVGGIDRTAEFTLIDRSDYEFPVLLGERFLSGTALVDVAQQFIADKPPVKNSP